MCSAHVTPAMSSGPVLRLRDETEEKTGQKADLLISINHPLKSVSLEKASTQQRP